MAAPHTEALDSEVAKVNYALQGDAARPRSIEAASTPYVAATPSPSPLPPFSYNVSGLRGGVRQRHHRPGTATSIRERKMLRRERAASQLTHRTTVLDQPAAGHTPTPPEKMLGPARCFSASEQMYRWSQDCHTPGSKPSTAVPSRAHTPFRPNSTDTHPAGLNEYLNADLAQHDIAVLQPVAEFEENEDFTLLGIYEEQSRMLLNEQEHVIRVKLKNEHQSGSAKIREMLKGREEPEAEGGVPAAAAASPQKTKRRSVVDKQRLREERESIVQELAAQQIRESPPDSGFPDGRRGTNVEASNKGFDSTVGFRAFLENLMVGSEEGPSSPSQLWKQEYGEKFFAYDTHYRQLADLVTQRPSAREKVAKYWWVQDVIRASPTPNRPLFDLLRADAMSRRYEQICSNLESEEQARRERIEELGNFILSCFLKELGDAILGLERKNEISMVAREAEARILIEQEEGAASKTYSKWREVRGICVDEEDSRGDLADEERTVRAGLEDTSVLSRPAHQLCHIAVGSDAPICVSCGFTLTVRFCAVTGEPHPSDTRCMVCGLCRYSNRFCSATGEPHDRIFKASETSSTAPPYRTTGPTLAVKAMRPGAVMDALEGGLPPARLEEELRCMVVPKMVLDICMDLHVSKKVPLPFLDVIYKDALSTLSVPWDVTLLPSTVEELELKTDDEEPEPTYIRESVSRAHDDDDCKSVRSKKSFKKQGKQLASKRSFTTKRSFAMMK